MIYVMFIDDEAVTMFNATEAELGQVLELQVAFLSAKTKGMSLRCTC